MITLDNLSYRYKNGVLALDNVSTKIGSGIHLLLGENGAGKTTLLHLIGGLLSAVPTDSCRIDDVPTALRLPSIQSSCFNFTDELKFPFRSIAEMVKYHAVFYPSFDPEMLRRNLEEFEMTGREPIDRFSLGNRKKAQLAYVLALRPAVLLMDEPANGLDITSRQKLLHLMARCVSEDQTVIISTHTVWDFQNLFDGVIVIHNAQLLLNESIGEIASRVAFVADTQPIENAIFMQQSIGQYRAIVPNDGTLSTDIDYTLLYTALLSPQAPSLLKVLKSTAV